MFGFRQKEQQRRNFAGAALIMFLLMIFLVEDYLMLTLAK